MSLKPFLHEHQLVYDKYENQEACCDQCNLHIDGWAFICEICKFWVHYSCAVQQLPLEISHPLHPKHPLQLDIIRLQYSSRVICNGCSSLTRRCFYWCRACDFNLDLVCASSTTITNHKYTRINHFCHIEHSLERFKYHKVNKYHDICFWCQKILCGVSYGCFLCQSPTESFIHETCLMSLPVIISKHHFHPSHQLQLPRRYSESYIPCGVCGYHSLNTCDGYVCEKCRFFIHFRCVQFKLSLKHDLHQHRLTLLPSKPELFGLEPCKKCRMEIVHRQDSVFNYYYRCVPCRFNFHLLCLIPSSIDLKYHRHELMLTHVFLEDDSDQYYCDVCEEERKAVDHVYCCNKCSFVAHIDCALKQIKDDANVDHESTSSLLGDKDSIGELKEEDEVKKRDENFSVHFEIKYCDEGHSLVLYEVIEKNERSTRCFVCGVEISGEAYACKSCGFYVHITCNRLSPEVIHPVHPQHSLKLIPLDSMFECRGCADVNYGGFAYVCYACDFVLHVKCATSWMPKTHTQKLTNMERQSKLCLVNQDHKLEYDDLVLHFSEHVRCSICRIYLFGPRYTCSDCRYSLHESCVGIPREMKIQFHPLHPLNLVFNTPKDCPVCIVPLNGQISYSCVQCDLYLHVHCAKSLKHVLKSKSHIHDLYYSRSRSKSWLDSYTCDACEREFYGIPFCFCMECDVKLHIERVFPRSLKSKYHIHPLTLELGFKEDDSEEYYCDICEEERDLKDHEYHCTECGVPFFSHLSCALHSAEEITASSVIVLDSCPSESED